MRCGIAEDEASEAIWSSCAEPDSRLPTHRKTAEVRAANFDGIQQRKNIVAELFLRIRSGRNGGKSVAASVVTNSCPRNWRRQLRARPAFLPGGNEYGRRWLL